MSRISKERIEKALEQLKTISQEDSTKVKSVAAIVKPLRSVLHKTPDGRRDESPAFCRSGKMPVLMFQVLEDAWTRNPEDAQKTFDLISSKDKELIWIEKTTRRFKDGYNYFGRHPEKVIAFFNKHLQ